MMTNRQFQPPLPDPSPAQPALLRVGRWTVQEHGRVTSTNLLAATLPAWHVVRAESQSAGRGRFQRHWVSDQGGLWLSAVVPLPTRAATAKLLPLAAGLALCEALQAVGAEGIHMRWPNDVLVEERKLAGLLIDQIVPGRAVVGIGVNVANDPEAGQASLAGQVSRLAELVRPVPTLRELMSRVLDALEAVWIACQTGNPESLLPRINALWQAPRPVRLELDSKSLTGQFEGVDAAGRLTLRNAANQIEIYQPHEVRLLREIAKTHEIIDQTYSSRGS